nr:hypothetical protein GCM10010200_043460 [Actinomadura rugatobispora]
MRFARVGVIDVADAVLRSRTGLTKSRQPGRSAVFPRCWDGPQPDEWRWPGAAGARAVPDGPTAQRHVQADAACATSVVDVADAAYAPSVVEGVEATQTFRRIPSLLGRSAAG